MDCPRCQASKRPRISSDGVKNITHDFFAMLANGEARPDMQASICSATRLKASMKRLRKFLQNILAIPHFLVPTFGSTHTIDTVFGKVLRFKAKCAQSGG